MPCLRSGVASLLLRCAKHARGWTNENMATAVFSGCKVCLNVHATGASNHNVASICPNHVHIQLTLVIHHKDVAAMNE